MKGLLQAPRFSEYVLLVLGSVFFGGLSVAVTFTAFVFHVNFYLVILTALGILVFGPLLIVWLTVVNVNDYAPIYAREHPSRFLTRMRDLRSSGFILDIAAAVSAIFFIAIFIDLAPHALNPIYSASIELSLIELTIMAVGMLFWHPQPLQLLLASLRSESDRDRPANKTWLDISLRNFNYVAASKHSKVILRGNVNLETLLFGQPLRQWTVERLLVEIQHEEYERFMGEIADLAGKDLPDVLERNSFPERIRQHSTEILTVVLTVVPVLVALWPYIGGNITGLIQLWANFLHLSHPKIHEFPPI